MARARVLATPARQRKRAQTMGKFILSSHIICARFPCMTLQPVNESTGCDYSAPGKVSIAVKAAGI